MFSVKAAGSAPLSYQWRFFGSNISGATLSNFSRSNVQDAYTGPYVVLVGNPLGWVTSTVANLSLTTAPLLGSVQMTGGVFTFVLSGPPGFNYAVERSSNLNDWMVLSTVSNSNGLVLFADPSASNFVYRYYRARLIP